MLNKFINLVVFVLAILPLTCMAEYMEPSAIEKAAAVNWVLSHSTADIKTAVAETIVEHVYYEASKFQIDPMMILGMMMTESGINPKARSREGAVGLLQVLPKYHRKELHGRSAYLPEVSIEVGVGIFNECLQRGNGNLLKSTKCYLGGKSNKYLKKILAYRKDLLEFTVNSIMASA